MVGLESLIPFDGLAELVLHDDWLVFLNHKPPGSDERPKLQGFQLFISDLKSHLNDCIKVSADPTKFKS